MSKAYIRFWQEADVDFIKKHLLIAGDLSGDCANCKQIGIDYKTATTCPGCKTDFNYIASRSSSAISDYGSLVRRIRLVRPDLVFIDFSDFRHITEKGKAQDFFK